MTHVFGFKIKPPEITAFFSGVATSIYSVKLFGPCFFLESYCDYFLCIEINKSNYEYMISTSRRKKTLHFTRNSFY